MHDILFHLPILGVPIHSYGVLVMLGFLTGLFVARWRARQVGLNAEHVTDVAIWALLGGIVGSRLLYIIQYPDTITSLLDAFKIWNGGLVFQGGLIGATIAAIIVIKHRRLPVLNMLDVLAPSVALGQAFGRIGCLMRGCCYGVQLPHDTWYALHFPLTSDVYAPGTGIELGAPVFPSQPLSSLLLLALFAALTLFWRRRRRMGDVLVLYLVLDSIQRFIIEFFRGDHTPGTMSPGQQVCIVLFFVGLIIFAMPRAKAAAMVDTAKSDNGARAKPALRKAEGAQRRKAETNG